MANDLLNDPQAILRFRDTLLAWYQAHKRDLVWRDSDDPYHIWISEIMLQQTRVDQMGPYFTRFITAFPTIQALAQADADQVLKLWEGLGYYARARNLHKAAKHITEAGNGVIPDTYDGLLALPGIGTYTAAAISSIAFDRDHPVLDGNVIRVLTRLLHETGDPRKAAIKTTLIAAGEKLLPPGQAGDFNQAMMELGARVCTPARPLCPTCPVKAHCRANHELNDPTVLPFKAPKKAKPHYQVAAGIIWKNGQILIAQRPKDGLLGGLWEFPGGKQEVSETLEECLVREIREELNLQIEVDHFATRVDHAYSHFSITLHAFHAHPISGEPQAIECAAWQWVDSSQLDDFAFSRADRHIIAHLQQNATQLNLFPSSSETAS